jgi:hypothetical protein
VLLKARLLGFALRVPAVTPVPESGIVKLESDAVDVMLTLPLAAPLALGSNVTVNDVLWPAAKVAPAAIPLKLNPAPLAEIAEMVRLVPPVLVRVSDRFVLVPTCTLPNARLAGLATRSPAVTPVPESGIVKLESDPVDVMLTLPLAAPLALGLKVIVNEVLWPAVSVTGRARPLKLNPVPLAAAAEIWRVVPPLLVRVSVSDLGAPTCTLPNATLVGLATRSPCVTPVPESGILRLGFSPLEVIFRLPLAEPLVVGENSTVKDVLWPAASIKPGARPLRLNPVPLAAAAEIVRLAPPEFVRVPVSDLEAPIWTLPKVKLVGFATN